MKTNQSLPFFALLTSLLLVQCKPNNPSTKPTGENSTTAQPASNAQQPDQYFRLQGTIGDMPVTVHLVGSLSGNGTGALFDGYYAYDKSTEPISLYGMMDSTGKKIVFEEAYSGNEPNKIEGTMSPDGSFTGIWSDPTGKKTYPVSWKPSMMAGSVAFKGAIYKDSLAAKPGVKNGPMANYEQNWLLPVDATEPALKGFLEKEIYKGMLGDSLGNLAKSAANAFEMGKNQSFEGYQEQTKDWDPADSTMGVAMYMQDGIVSMQVFFNENNLLTLGFMEYAYTGGAHGNYGTEVKSYDLAKKQVIKLDDLFKPGYKKKLTVALNKNARRKFGLAPNAKLSTILFDDSIAPNENFGLTSKGIFFNYTPYEIASYAQGEIQVFVPFEDIKDILKEPK